MSSQSSNGDLRAAGPEESTSSKSQTFPASGQSAPRLSAGQQLCSKCKKRHVVAIESHLGNKVNSVALEPFQARDGNSYFKLVIESENCTSITILDQEQVEAITELLVKENKKVRESLCVSSVSKGRLVEAE